MGRSYTRYGYKITEKRNSTDWDEEDESSYAKLEERQDHSDYHRPHGGLDGQTSYERVREKSKPKLRPCSRSSSVAH